jgi:hypothetical protein
MKAMGRVFVMASEVVNRMSHWASGIVIPRRFHQIAGGLDFEETDWFDISYTTDAAKEIDRR